MRTMEDSRARGPPARARADPLVLCRILTDTDEFCSCCSEFEVAKEFVLKFRMNVLQGGNHRGREPGHRISLRGSVPPASP